MSVTIDGYPIDVALTTKFSRKSSATKYPIEKGADVTDHVQPDLPEIEFEGIVSNTPIGAIALDVTRINPSGAETPSKDAYRRLYDMQNLAKVVVVECALGKFEDMTITELTIPVTGKDFKGLRFTVTFSKLTFVENNRTTVQSEFPGKQNFGLSLDKLIASDHILWRKGQPPGTSSATDPAGVITSEEIVSVQKGKVLHADGKPLTTPELQAFTKDLNRDSALQQRRTLKRAENRSEEVDRRADAAIRYANAKHDHPNAKIDPAMFGLKDKGN